MLELSHQNEHKVKFTTSDSFTKFFSSADFLMSPNLFRTNVVSRPFRHEVVLMETHVELSKLSKEFF